MCVVLHDPLVLMPLGLFASYDFPACLLIIFTRIDCITEKKAAELLGYTQVSWDTRGNETQTASAHNETQAASIYKAWPDIPDMEKKALAVLGFSRLHYYPWPAVMHKYFAEFTASEKAAAGELGFNATSWDDDDEPQPAAWNTHWLDLSKKDKAAAMLLGFNEFTWHNSPPDPPASVYKNFANLRTTCGENAFVAHPLAYL